jgi:ubiquinone/menaquinone biosynthesis C-methylase UbiE
MTHPPVCDYEGSDYQSSFWDKGERVYEDRVEAIALRRLLPKSGHLLLELGAGAGRNTPRYSGFERVVLLDYSRTQLRQAQARLGETDRYIYVAANIYRLPFVEGLFDAATMIRTLHHMADAPRALKEVQNSLASGATFILEFANKRNAKAVVRYLLGRQKWSPFSREPVEFADLNFDFHPESVRTWLENLNFRIERVLTVSHFRSGILKRLVPTSLLVAIDSLLQWTGSLGQLTPSVYLKAVNCRHALAAAAEGVLGYFKCPECGHSPLRPAEDFLECSNCARKWRFEHGIYDFREPAS